jgi:molecular chaperone GrpE
VLLFSLLSKPQEISDKVKGNVLEELIPLIDNFEAAKQYIKPETDGERKIETSYQALYKQMVELFRKMGIEAVPTVGKPFDPAIHEAIMRTASADVTEDTVSQEFRKGFRIGGRLIRPATVAVSVPAEGGAAPAAEGDGAAEEEEGAAAEAEA